MAFVCNNCPYAQNPAINLKYENNKSNHLLVFQSPGYDEWMGKNLTTSGKRIPIDSISPHSCAARMRNSFSRKKVSRKDYDIAEAVCCFPGKLSSNGRDKKPTVKSINQCAVNMSQLLSKNKYLKITCFGSIAYDVVNKAIKIIKNWTGPIPTHVSHPSGRISNETLDQSY